MVDKAKLIELGLAYNFLNHVDHETPRIYYHRDVYLDTDDINILRESVLELHQLLCGIYAEVDVV